MTENYPPYPTKLVPGGTGGAPTPAGGERYYPLRPEGTEEIPTSGGAAAGAPGFNRQKFVENYANMVARTWTDESYLNLILADPGGALAAAGLPVTEGAVFRIIQCKVTGQGSIGEQVDAWLEGIRTGRYDVCLPIKPDDIEITGAGEAGGCAVACCCTPSCSCW
jgi:hypothetical protein